MHYTFSNLLFIWFTINHSAAKTSPTYFHFKSTSTQHFFLFPLLFTSKTQRKTEKSLTKDSNYSTMQSLRNKSQQKKEIIVTFVLNNEKKLY